MEFPSVEAGLSLRVILKRRAAVTQNAEKKEAIHGQEIKTNAGDRFGRATAGFKSPSTEHATTARFDFNSSITLVILPGVHIWETNPINVSVYRKLP
jgi:hypothetical protein